MPMNRILPDGPRGSEIQGRLVCSRVSQALEAVSELRDRLGISRFGCYSTERAQVLNIYSQSTSLLRVFAICAITPVPAFLLAILLEILPLQEPSEGWKANYVVWIRLFVYTATAAVGSLVQIRNNTADLPYSKVCLIGIATGCGAMLTMVALAAVWVFPIPFGIVLASIPFQIFFAIFFLTSVRRHGSSSLVPQLSATRKHQLYLILAQPVLAFCYVTFSVIFAKCNSTQQFGLFVLLPIVKLAYKHFIAWLASDNKEIIPVVVVFTVDVFNGLYVSACIQSSQSWWGSFQMITLTIAQTLISLWDIYKKATALDCLSRRSRSGDRFKGSRRTSFSLFQSSRSHRRIVSSEGGTDVQSTQLAQKQRQSQTLLETKLDIRSRSMLFHLEYLVLVAYVECIVPVLYVLHLLVLLQLPSAKYYAHTADLSSSQLRTSVGCILLYASAESFSLVWLHIVLRCKFGFSLLYQLAFVLETEKEQHQGRLFMWIAPLLQLMLVHFGTKSTLHLTNSENLHKNLCIVIALEKMQVSTSVFSSSGYTPLLNDELPTSITQPPIWMTSSNDITP